MNCSFKFIHKSGDLPVWGWCLKTPILFRSDDQISTTSVPRASCIGASLLPSTRWRTDLMPLDVGPLYRKIMETVQDHRLYGLIPLMATSSYGQIGGRCAQR